MAVYGGYPDLNGIKKILVIKLRHLGDALLTGPVFAALRNRFPDAEIDAYVYQESFPMLEGHPGVDRLIGYDRAWKKGPLLKRLRAEWRLLKSIRQEGYDLVIQLTEGDRGALAARISRARVRVGFQPKGKWQQKLYTHLVKHCPTPRHAVEKNLDALRRIGLFPAPEERELFLAVGKEPLARVKKWVQGPFVLIHPTSRWRFKCWPVDKMRELAKRFIEEGSRVVFSSGPDPVERDMVASIAEGLDALNLSGKITLQELFALISLSELLISVDSVPFHVANALKKPVVALFGPTSEIAWGPWRNRSARVATQNLSCRPCNMDGCGGSKMSDCLATLSVDAVWATIENLRRNSSFALVDR